MTAGPGGASSVLSSSAADPLQGLGLTEQWHAEINARDKHIGRRAFSRDAVCPPVVRVVERTAIPVVEANWPKSVTNCQAAQRALAEFGVPIFVVARPPPFSIAGLCQQSVPSGSHSLTSGPVQPGAHRCRGWQLETWTIPRTERIELQLGAIP